MLRYSYVVALLTHIPVLFISASTAERLPEQEILIQSVMETVVPKLVADDIPLLNSLLSDVFPGVQYEPAQMEALRREINKVCAEHHLVCTRHNLNLFCGVLLV